MNKLPEGTVLTTAVTETSICIHLRYSLDHPIAPDVTLYSMHADAENGIKRPISLMFEFTAFLSDVVVVCYNEDQPTNYDAGQELEIAAQFPTTLEGYRSMMLEAARNESNSHGND